MSNRPGDRGSKRFWLPQRAGGQPESQLAKGIGPDRPRKILRMLAAGYFFGFGRPVERSEGNSDIRQLVEA